MEIGKQIPKVIHYCWFGKNPLPPLAEKCILSWKKFLPDYEIKEWNEDNFDVRIIPYTSDAYDAKKYAFVSDYARFWILFHYGGIYFDTDVEVIRPMEDIIKSGPFMGCERPADLSGNTEAIFLGVAPGLGLGAYPNMEFYRKFLDYYRTIDFNEERAQNKTVVHYATHLLVNEGLVNTNEIQQVAGISIYPNDYFCPINSTTNRMKITPNTRSIHHYAGSWTDKTNWTKDIKKILQPFIPETILLKWHHFKKARKDSKNT